MTPAAAKNFHESSLMIESPEQLANSRINPPAKWIYQIHEKWLKENFGGLNYGPDFEKIALNRIKEYQEKGSLIEFATNHLCIAVITPLMQRMVKSLEKSHSIFVDSSASCDQAKSSITMVLVSTKAGAIPIGIGIHSFQNEANYSKLFSQLNVEMWEKINLFTIENFMTDDSAALKAALRQIFPSTRQLLCQFHVPQAFWRWLWNSQNNIANDDRKNIMFLFRQIMYATSVEEYAENVNKFFNSKYVQNYPNLIAHVSSFLKRKEEWCMCYRLDVRNLSHNTNNYSEATVRILKEIILTRLKAFNSIALLEFVLKILEKYLSKRLLDIVFDCLKKPHLLFQKYMDKGQKIIEECTVEKEDKIYIVQSQNNTFYQVDIGICSCPVGIQGAFCKHQAAVHIKFGVTFPNAPILTMQEKKNYYCIAVGSTNVCMSFLEPMTPGPSHSSQTTDYGNRSIY